MTESPKSPRCDLGRTKVGLFVVGCCFLVAVGCGSGRPELVPVAGRVTLDGKPVSEGQIEFFPEESGRPAIGNIDSEGHYELQTYKPRDGAKPGNYQVAITSQIIPTDDSPVYKSFEDEMQGNAIEPADSSQLGRNPSRITWLIPPRYSDRDSSGLVVEVGHDGRDIDFELKSKP